MDIEETTRALVRTHDHPHCARIALFLFGTSVYFRDQSTRKIAPALHSPRGVLRICFLLQQPIHQEPSLDRAGLDLFLLLKTEWSDSCLKPQRYLLEYPFAGNRYPIDLSG